MAVKVRVFFLDNIHLFFWGGGSMIKKALRTKLDWVARNSSVQTYPLIFQNFTEGIISIFITN